MKAITILSYCDTTEKKDLLKSIIARAKHLYPDRAVLVYSHYSGVEPEYYAQADYYIYDHSNPSSPRVFYDWVYIPQIGIKFYRGGSDFGLAVLQMIKRSALFLESIGVESSLYLNYDMNIDGSDTIKLIDISESLIDHVGIFTKWGDDHFSLCYFWLDIKKIGRSFFESIDREKYLSYDTSFIAEKIFHEIMTEGLGSRCLRLDVPLEGKISGATREVAAGSDLRRLFGMMVASRSSADHSKSLAIWNSTIDIDYIFAEIDGIETQIFNQLENKRFFLGRLPDEISEISITGVNGERVDRYPMNLDTAYWEKNTHEKHPK